MTDYLTKAIFELGVKDWVLRGKPTTESEFNSMFRKVIGKTSNYSAIESDKPSDFGVTWKQVSDKMKAFKQGKDVYVTIPNPNKNETNKRFIRVNAKTVWTKTNPFSMKLEG